MTSMILELIGPDKIYPNGTHAVKQINHRIVRGSMTALPGPNGAGKTTTIGMICGLCRPTGGRIQFNGNRIDGTPAACRRSIGVVSQHLNLELDCSARQNLEINVSRFITNFFEEYLLSPVPDSWIVMGNILYGMTKGVGSFLAMILIAILFGATPVNIAILFPAVLFFILVVRQLRKAVL